MTFDQLCERITQRVQCWYWQAVGTLALFQDRLAERRAKTDTRFGRRG